MKPKQILVVGILLLGIAASYIFVTSLQSKTSPAANNPHAGHQMDTVDDAQADHMMHMMVESEQDFIIGMIPHHQEAVDTAKEVLARGGTLPEIAALAEGIIIAQESEITMMEAWHLAWYSTPYQADGTYQPMMRDLGNLSGTELDRAFLEDMIPHHMGAIMMAESVQPHITQPEMTTLTAEIMASQSAEIEEMRRLLNLLPGQN